MMRHYEVEMVSGKVYSIDAKAAQLAVNHVYNFCGEHEEIKSVIRISPSEKRVECTWK